LPGSGEGSGSPWSANRNASYVALTRHREGLQVKQRTYDLRNERQEIRNSIGT